MTAITDTVDITASRPTRVLFVNLVRVEARKIVDTRAGRALMVAIVLAATAAAALIMLTTPRGELSWKALTDASAVPLTLLLPIMGVVAATAEWSQRTALTTFVLEPRRLRVGLAKCVAALLVAVATTVAALALGAIVNVVGIVAGDGTTSWTLPIAPLAGGLLMLLIGVAQGVAFGLALGRSAPAIVALFLVPTVWTVASTVVSAIRPVVPWLDLWGTSAILPTGTMHGLDWLHLATASAVWVGLPLVVGLVRLRRHEFK